MEMKNCQQRRKVGVTLDQQTLYRVRGDGRQHISYADSGTRAAFFMQQIWSPLSWMDRLDGWRCPRVGAEFWQDTKLTN